jgi:rare lipoprotein A
MIFVPLGVAPQACHAPELPTLPSRFPCARQRGSQPRERVTDWEITYPRAPSRSFQQLTLRSHFAFFDGKCVMRSWPYGIAVIALSLPALHASPAFCQSFEDRWPIIPKANAEPAPPANVEPAPPPVEQPEAARDPQSVLPSTAEEPSKLRFSGRASFYSYHGGKTASGAAFDRNALTAAHRNLPFGTRVRVTDPATKRTVVVVITDRGPHLRNRVLDLSLGAARALGITDRGVVRVLADVL